MSFLPFDPSAHDIVDLSELSSETISMGMFLHENEWEQLLVDHLQHRGWCIVKLPPKLQEAQELVAPLNQFFAKPESEKEKAFLKPQFGYSKVDHKEGIRFLSQHFPREVKDDKLRQTAHQVCNYLDAYSLRISLALAQRLGISASKLAVEADLPVAYGSHYGMFDIAKYFNKLAGQSPPAEGTSVDDVNCVPHYDPGFLSISFFSDAEGLQMLDPETNQWYAAPLSTIDSQKEYGVLWLGQAGVKASEGKWKAGIHRVIYPATSGSRLTMWYEMCTVDQVNGPDDAAAVPEGEIQLPNIKGPGSMMLTMKGDTQTDVLRRIERKRGLPMSKVPRIQDSFRAPPSFMDFDLSN